MESEICNYDKMSWSKYKSNVRQTYRIHTNEKEKSNIIWNTGVNCNEYNAVWLAEEQLQYNDLMTANEDRWLQCKSADWK